MAEIAIYVYIMGVVRSHSRSLSDVSLCFKVYRLRRKKAPKDGHYVILLPIERSSTLDIAPLREGTSPLKRSGMASLPRDHTVLPALPPTRLSTNGMNHTCLCLPSRSWSSFTDPGGVESWVGLGTITVSKQSVRTACRKSQFLAAQTATPHRATGNAAGYERRTHDLLGRQLQREPTVPPSHPYVTSLWCR